MAYQGNTAYQLDYSQNTWEVPVGRGLSLHEGGGIDAQVRRQTSSMAGLVRLVVAATIALALLGVCRVALTVRTVSALQDLSEIESNVSQALDTRTALQVERSVLSATDRLQRIATENYGMVYASEVDTINIQTSATPQGEASADAAQSAEEADALAPVA